MRHLRFGIFMPGVHGLDENPYFGVEQDFQVIEHIDKIGFDEAWVGEHHSAGFEVIDIPELFIAAAAERTKHIKFGTGVTSLPYHHPLMTAVSWMQLYNMTRGRVMFGCGPGSLVSDARMMGIPPEELRGRMEQALGAITRLLRGEVVTEETSWYKLVDAQVQATPFNGVLPLLSTASMVSPSGPRAAGKFGTGLLSLSATAPTALNAAGENWRIAEETAAEFGHSMDRSEWRMMALIHVAETREQAIAEVAPGMDEFVEYFEKVGTLPLVPPDRLDSPTEHLIDSGMAIIGSPDDAIEQIERLWTASEGGFGCFLAAEGNWARFSDKLKSYELIARHVMPHFQDHNSRRKQSNQIARDKHSANVQAVNRAIGAETEKLQVDRERRSKLAVPAE